MKLNVAVIFGSETVEHEVSVISAHQAMNALDPEKYNVIPLYISKQRRFYYSELLRDIKNYTNLDDLISRCEQVVLANVDNKVIMKPVKDSLFGKKVLGTIDIAIPVMHGTNGEDGAIQVLLDAARVPYTGPGAEASRISFDKILSRRVLQDAGLPVAKGFVLRPGDDPSAIPLPLPFVVKPPREGSSVGVTIVRDAADIAAAVEAARAKSPEGDILVEDCTFWCDWAPILPIDALPAMGYSYGHFDAQDYVKQGVIVSAASVLILSIIVPLLVNLFMAGAAVG